MNELINNQSESEILKIVKDNQKNFEANKKIIEQILIKERGYLVKINKNDSVVLLVSGGLDSIITMAYIVEKFEVNVYPLFIKRGARAEKKELESAKYYVKFYQERYGSKIKDLFVLNDEDIPARQLKSYFPQERIKAIGHPLRNSTLQNYAVMYATYVNAKFNENVRTILTGSVGDDTIDLELTPKTIFKRDLILWAKEKEISLSKTRTCVSEGEISDGTCNECIRRLKVFRELGLRDEIEYLSDENF